MSMFRRAMEYLGLGPDEVYDDSDQSVRSPRPGRGRGTVPHDDDDDAVDDDFEEVDDLAPPRTRRVRDDSGVTVRGPGKQPPGKNVRPLDSASPEVVTLKPTSFAHCKEIGERFRAGQPVVMNLIATSPDEGRRIIDFASGLTFGLNGSMERVSRGVFRLVPNGVRIPRD